MGTTPSVAELELQSLEGCVPIRTVQERRASNSRPNADYILATFALRSLWDLGFVIPLPYPTGARDHSGSSAGARYITSRAAALRPRTRPVNTAWKRAHGWAYAKGAGEGSGRRGRWRILGACAGHVAGTEGKSLSRLPRHRPHRLRLPLWQFTRWLALFCRHCWGY